ncbi:Hypothetical protein CINCED_3A008192 [Cinara cedri]|uniref:Uncharacterized protein n=1 Tax=Cinara cedri TaxID=506608 RepID=A0A5E4NA47_9HEMI|nr:Hypothetical protein CINCED_3A008192 [Cinara cedri]
MRSTNTVLKTLGRPYVRPQSSKKSQQFRGQRRCESCKAFGRAGRIVVCRTPIAQPVEHVKRKKTPSSREKYCQKVTVTKKLVEPEGPEGEMPLGRSNASYEDRIRNDIKPNEPGIEYGGVKSGFLSIVILRLPTRRYPMVRPS